jgi:ATP-dependent helicase/nuclease subunit A
VNALKIYKSSAGSGKTFTLVKEYLRIVLEHPGDYKHILAITFTNKATEEMKSRIVNSLVDLSEGGNEFLEEILQAELPGINIKAQAKKALELILHDYSSFSVCTIDSFFQKIMRALAREIHLPLRFEVEMRKDEVIEQITEKLLNDVGKDAELTEWLTDLVLQKLDDEKSWNIEGDIRFIADQLFKEKSIGEQPLTRDKIRTVFKKLLAIKKTFESKMKFFGDGAVSTIESGGFASSDFTQKDRGIAGYFYRIRSSNGPEKYKPNSHVLKALESADHWFPKASPRKKELLDLVESHLRKHLKETVLFFEETFPLYTGAIEALRKIYILGIVNDLQKKLGEYREEKNIVLISDTPKILQSFISTDDAPFIFEKTGNRYKHFLIDEFQDTSDLQWKNLLPLVINSLGSGNFAMVVGDAKQSIYRWRGGNMNLLARELRQQLKPFDSIIREENLVTNFRSKRTIIDFNNAFFSAVPAVVNHSLEIKEDTLLHLVYSEELKQEVAGKNDSGGFVNVQFFEDDKSIEDDQSLTWKGKSLNKMLEVIHALFDQNFSMSDIAILVRNNQEGNDVADFLFDHGITKILSPDSLLLARSSVIRFLIHAFRFLADNSNQVARSEVLYYYFVYLSKQENKDMHMLFTDKSKAGKQKVKTADTLFDTTGFDDTLFNKLLPQDFSEHLLYLSKLPVYDLSEHLVRIFGLNKNPDAYIQRFQDLVLEYATKNNSSLSGFLQWWDESETVRNCSVTIAENEDAIRIMTIHKSKGLQFPAVIMPFADWKLLPDSRDLLWVSSEIEPFKELGTVPLSPSKKLLDSCFSESYRDEITQAVIDNINLLYVAFTRAEEQLFIFCPEDPEGDLNSTGKLISRVILQQAAWKKYVSEEKSFSMGEARLHVKNEKKIKHESFTLHDYPSNRWQGRISITTHSTDLIELLQPTATTKINYGILVHKILSEINSESDVEKTISKYYFEGLFSEDEKKNLEQEIQVLLSIPQMKTFFSNEWTVKAEREIILPDGEVLRPDRVLIKGNKAIVIDFKTGKESSSHIRQVDRYAEILTAMNYADVEKYLVYVNEKSVRKIT